MRLWQYLEADGVDGLRRGHIKVIWVSSVEYRHVAHCGYRDQDGRCVHYPDGRKMAGEQFAQKASLLKTEPLQIIFYQIIFCSTKDLFISHQTRELAAGTASFFGLGLESEV